MEPGGIVTEEAGEAVSRLAQAYAFEGKGELQAALWECDMVLEQVPYWAEAHNLRGIILDGLGHASQAAAAYEEALRLDPDYEEARLNLEELALESAKTSSEALHLDPRYEKAQLTVEELAAEVTATETPVATSATTQTTLPEKTGKGFAIRGMAYVIDLIALYVANLVAGFVGGIVLGFALVFITRQGFVIDHETTNTVASCLGGLVLGVLYFGLFEALYGASPGKLLLGMRVVRTDGRRCSFKAAFTRALYRYIDGIIFGAVAYSYMKDDPACQRLGDRKARTIVVDRKDSLVKKRRDWGWFIVAGFAYLALATIINTLLVIPAIRTGPAFSTTIAFSF